MNSIIQHDEINSQMQATTEHQHAT